jgi:hypothetical protein
MGDIGLGSANKDKEHREPSLIVLEVVLNPSAARCTRPDS